MARRAQVTPEQYFDAALRILGGVSGEVGGPAGLTIGRLCAELQVTSGAFYHHFGGWDGFVEALLEHWEAEQTRRLVELSAGRPDPWERLDVLKHLATTVPHAAEAAIRAWGRTDAAVGRAQRRVDDLRRDGLRAVILGLGVPADAAERLATMGIALLAGSQQMDPGVGTDELLSVFDEFERSVVAYTDQPARAGLLSRRAGPDRRPPAARTRPRP